MLRDITGEFKTEEDVPVIIMDAGIATQNNLEIIKQHKYDYVCVSRSFPAEYTALTENATQLQDNLGHKIEVSKVWDEDKQEVFLQIKSEQKQLKEDSIDEKMQSQQVSIVSLNSKSHEKIFTKLVTRPSCDQQSIYDALNYKHRPFIRKTKVVPQW